MSAHFTVKQTRHNPCVNTKHERTVEVNAKKFGLRIEAIQFEDGTDTFRIYRTGGQQDKNADDALVAEITEKKCNVHEIGRPGLSA